MAQRTVRTFSILGADGAGKTALVEAFLRAADAKRASPEGSTSRLDAEPEEKKRNFTLSIHPETFEEGGATFNVLDTPGFAAFINEAEWALQVTDGAVLVISGVDGTHNRAERLYDALAESKVPALGVVGRLDHEQADFRRTLSDIEASLKVKPVPVHIPIGQGASLKGLVNLFTMRAHLYDKAFGKMVEADVPAEVKAEADAARTVLVEAAAESDDELLGKYLEGGALSAEEVVRGLSAGAAQQRFLPIAVVAAKPGIGVRELLDLVTRVLPGPEGRVVKGTDSRGQGGGTPRGPRGTLLRSGIPHHHRSLRRAGRLPARALRDAEARRHGDEPAHPRGGADRQGLPHRRRPAGRGPERRAGRRGRPSQAQGRAHR